MYVLYNFSVETLASRQVHYHLIIILMKQFYWCETIYKIRIMCSRGGSTFSQIKNRAIGVYSWGGARHWYSDETEDLTGQPASQRN